MKIMTQFKRAVLVGVFAASCVSATLQATTVKSNKVFHIGIIQPLQHEAMTEITQAFKRRLKNYDHINAIVTIKNGQLDPNIEHAIISQMQNNDTDIIEPIGTSLFEMTLAAVPHKTVLGIATPFAEKQRLAMNPIHATAINDEINPQAQLNFLQGVVPHLKQITIIHSADDKYVQQMKHITALAAKMGIKVQNLMIMSSADLYTMSHHVSNNSQVLFVLKDHMVVSGMPQLAQQAQTLKIPLIASDDGSVQNGAGLAFGVTEAQIGERAADITAQIIKGTPIKAIPVQSITDYKIFLNRKMLLSQGFTLIDIHKLYQLSKQNHYPIILCSKEGCHG